MSFPPTGEPADGKSGLPAKVWRAGTLTYTSGALALLFAWLLFGDFAWSLKERSIPPVAQLLIKKFAASDAITALLVVTLPAAILIISGPIISYKSDRHRGRWGRRIPFLFIPTPIVVLSLGGLAASPALGARLHEVLGAHSPGLAASTLIVFGFCWTVFEAAAVTANTIFSALINDVVPVPMLGRFFSLFRTVGMMTGLIFNYWLVGKAESHFAAIFIGMAALYGVGLTVMCLKVKEGGYPPVVESEESRSGLASTIAYFRECFGKSYYRWFFVSAVLGNSAFIPVGLFAIFYAKSLGMSLDTYGQCMVITYLVAFAITYPLGSLADRFHPLRIGLMGMALYAVVAAIGFLCIRSDRTFAICFVAHGIFSSGWLAATASLKQRLLPKTKFAQYASGLDILQSLVVMLIGPAIGLVLDATGHDYRYIFLASFVTAVGSFLAGLVVYRKFKALGGTRSYLAPD